MYKKKSQLWAHGLFYMKFNTKQLLSEVFFKGSVFLAVLNPKQNVFCCFSTLYFKHINLSSPLAPLRGGGRQTYALTDFFIGNSIPNKFYPKLFFMGCVFLAVLSPKQKVFCCFSTLYFKHINLSSPLAPLRGETNVCARGLFYKKFNSQ